MLDNSTVIYSEAVGISSVDYVSYFLWFDHVDMVEVLRCFKSVHCFENIKDEITLLITLIYVISNGIYVLAFLLLVPHASINLFCGFGQIQPF